MLDLVVNSASPSSPTPSHSWTITAADPLSWTSAILARSVALPSVGSGRCTTRSWPPYSTVTRSRSIPGNLSAGGSNTLKAGATSANVGSTRRSFSVVSRSSAGVHGVGARAEGQVVQQDVVGGPDERLLGQVGPDRDYGIDGHAAPARLSSRR